MNSPLSTMTVRLPGGVTRRRLLSLAALPLLPTALTVRGSLEGNAHPLNVIGALEAHGQWATSPAWALDIHSSLGCRSVSLGYGEARGANRVERATQRALATLDQNLTRAVGVVVLLLARQSSTLLLDAKTALNEARDVLPLSVYQVFSPLASAEHSEEIGVLISLGW